MKVYKITAKTPVKMECGTILKTWNVAEEYIDWNNKYIISGDYKVEILK